MNERIPELDLLIALLLVALGLIVMGALVLIVVGVAQILFEHFGPVLLGLAVAMSVGGLAGCATLGEPPTSNTAAVSTSTTTTMPESTTTTTPPPPTTTPPPTTLPLSLGPTFVEFRWANANSGVLQGFAGGLMFFALDADAYRDNVAAAPTAAEAKRSGALFSAACDATGIDENPANRSLALVCAVARATADAIELAEAGSTAEATALSQPFADDRNSVSVAFGVLISADTAG